jgi:hypothetical protein
MTLNVPISKNACTELLKPMCIEIKLVCVTCKNKFGYRYMCKIARIMNLNGCEAFTNL